MQVMITRGSGKWIKYGGKLLDGDVPDAPLITGFD